MDIGHGASWWGVKDGENLAVNRPVFLCWGWNDNGKIKEITVKVFHVSGFRENGECVVLNEQVFDHSAFCNSYNDESRILCKDIMLCPRTGVFKVQIKVSLRGTLFESCPRQQVTKEIYFTIKPDLTIPVAVNNLVSTVCPNQATYMEIDGTVPGQHGADWFGTPTCDGFSNGMTSERRGYRYDLNLAPLQTMIKYPAYYRNYQVTVTNFEHGDPRYESKGCIVHGLRVPNAAVGASVDALPSPAPIFRTVCNPDSERFEVENPLKMYDGVFWYTEATGGVPVHDGFKYSRKFTEPYTILYISYYNRYGDDCVIQSGVKSPVIVINLKKLTEESLSSLTRPISKNYKITDYRDVSSTLRCNEPGEEGKYWIDLENDQLASELDALEAALEDVINSNHIPLVSISAKVTDTYWVAFDDSGQPQRDAYYLRDLDKKVVCSDYICAKGKTGVRRYEKRGDIRVSFSFFNPVTNREERGSDQVCGTRLLAIANVSSVHPQQTDSTYCQALKPEDLVNVLKVNAQFLAECDNVQTLSACPEELYTIGPSDTEVKLMYVKKGGTLSLLTGPQLVKSVIWTPVTGLADSKALRTTVHYNSLPDATSSFSKYTEAITFVDGLKANHCVVFYKCTQCGLVKPPKNFDDPVIPKP